MDPLYKEGKDWGDGDGYYDGREEFRRQNEMTLGAQN